MRERIERRRRSFKRSVAAAACAGLLATVWTACSGDNGGGGGGDDGGPDGTSSGVGSSSSSSGGRSSSSGTGSSTSSSGASGSGSSSGGDGGRSSSSGASSSGSTSSSGSASSSGSSSSSSGGSSSSSSSGGSSSSSSSGGRDGGDAATSSSSSGGDASTEAASDAAGDSTTADATTGDAATDATGGDGGGEASASDAGADVGVDAGTPFQWCPYLDVTYALVTDAGAEPAACATQTIAGCPDRLGNNTFGQGWASPILDVFDPPPTISGIAADFLALLGGNGLTGTPGDCRIDAMAGPQTLTNQQVTDYTNQVGFWTLALFGCPDPTQSTGPSGFGLIPAPVATHAFTTADMQLLEDMYIAGINQSLTDNNMINGGPTQLTAAQEAEIRAKIATEEAAFAPTPSPIYSWSTCPVDGGDGG